MSSKLLAPRRWPKTTLQYSVNGILFVSCADPYKVMAPGSTRFPTLGGTSVEATFKFPDVIPFIDSVLAAIDKGVYSDDKLFPAGYLALCVCGRTAALLGMEQFERNGTFEVTLIRNFDDFALVRKIEQITRDQGGVLHWGQSNGLMSFADLEFAYGTSGLEKWQAAQRALGGDTFTNYFMKRCGLA